MLIKNLGSYGSALKLECDNKGQIYFFYYYKGNSRQNFIVNKNGDDITPTKEGINIYCNCMNYIFNTIYKNGN